MLLYRLAERATVSCWKARNEKASSTDSRPELFHAREGNDAHKSFVPALCLVLSSDDEGHVSSHSLTHALELGALAGLTCLLAESNHSVQGEYSGCLTVKSV